MYKQISKIFGRNTAYRLLVTTSSILERLPFLRLPVKLRHRYDRALLRTGVFELDFPNPMGLGPGVDKDARMLEAMRAYGFGFVCIGPLDSENIKAVIRRLQERESHGIAAACIGRDHLHTFSLAYDFADMFVIDAPYDEIINITDSVLDTRLSYESYKPVLIRIAHDLPDDRLEELIDFCLLNGVDGAVVGGSANVARIREISKGLLPMIGYGGIRSGADAERMLDAGASLVAITTGIILDGPSLARKVIRHLESNK